MANVVIAEDDPKTSSVLAQHLARLGHECKVTSSGKSVLRLAHDGGWDMLILDAMLPDVSGFEVCRRIRRDPDLYTMPILMLSAMSGEEEIMHGLAQGADDYVAKPFEVQSLLRRIETLLNASSSARMIDDITALPDGDTVKRELRHKLSRGEVYAVAYIELVNLRTFAYSGGADVRSVAIRRLGEMLYNTGMELFGEDAVLGHLGGGHFVNAIPSNNMKSYFDQVKTLWNDELEGLYNSAGQEHAYRAATTVQNRTQPLLEPLFCVTTHVAKTSIAIKELFDVLTHLRNMAITTNKGGVFIDRRG